MASIDVKEGEDATTASVTDVGYSTAESSQPILKDTENSELKQLPNKEQVELVKQQEEIIDKNKQLPSIEQIEPGKQPEEILDEYKQLPNEEQFELCKKPEKNPEEYKQPPSKEEVEGKQPNDIPVEFNDVNDESQNVSHDDCQHCKCTIANKIGRAFTCGGCLKVFSTICKLHEHLECSHTDTELYFFDKKSQTAFPRFGTTCKVTQTETEMIETSDFQMAGENEDVHVLGYSDTGKNSFHFGSAGSSKHSSVKGSTKRKRKARKAYLNFPNIAVSENQLDAAIKTEFQMTESTENSDRLESDALQRYYNISANELTNSVCEFSVPDIAIKTEVIKDYETVPYNKIPPVSSKKNNKKVRSRKGKSNQKQDKGKEKRKRIRPKKKASDNLTVVLIKNTKKPRAAAPAKCSSCHEKFNSRKLLSEHMRISEKCRPRCSVCDKSFISKSVLKSHMTLIHKESSKTLDNMCENCGETFPYPSALRLHIIHCLDIRSFVCQVENCGKTYRRQADLDVHMQYHSGEASFVCEICGNAYIRINALNNHLQSQHSKERKFICDECPKAFFRRALLLKHKKTHAKVLPFVCECGKSFVSRWSLKAHQRQHTGEKPYSCENCGAAFAHNVSKRNHMKTCSKSD